MKVKLDLPEEVLQEANLRVKCRGTTAERVLEEAITTNWAPIYPQADADFHSDPV